MLSRFAKGYSSYAGLLLRLSLGLVFLLHGWQKVNGLAGVQAFFASLGLPSWLAVIVSFSELIGGAALIVGLLTRFFALLIALIMAGAIATAKSSLLFSKPILGFELELMLMFAALALLLIGPQKYSVDTDILKKELI